MPDAVIDSMILTKEVPMSSLVALEHVYKLDENGEPFELWYAPGNRVAEADVSVLEARGCKLGEFGDEHAVRRAIAQAHRKAVVKTTPGPDKVQAVAAEQRAALAEAEADNAVAEAQEAPVEPEPEAEAETPAEPAGAAEGEQEAAAEAVGEPLAEEAPVEDKDQGQEAAEDKAVRGPKETKKSLKPADRKANA